MTRMDRWREREKGCSRGKMTDLLSLSFSPLCFSRCQAERDGTGAPSLPRPCSSNLLTYPRTPFNRMFLKRIKRDRFVVSPWIGPSKIRGGEGKEGRPISFGISNAPPFPRRRERIGECVSLEIGKIVYYFWGREDIISFVYCLYSLLEIIKVFYLFLFFWEDLWECVFIIY